MRQYKSGQQGIYGRFSNLADERHTESHLLLLEISDKGEMKYPEMRLRDLFKYVQKHASVSGYEPPSARRQSSNDDNIRRSTNSRGSKAAIHVRDLRRLDMKFSALNQPTVMVRQFVVLLNFDPLRAIVLADRVVVLVPNGADSILDKLQQKILFNNTTLSMLASPSDVNLIEEEEVDVTNNATMTFAFRAIEAVLTTVVSNLEGEQDSLTNRIHPVLNLLHANYLVSIETLEQLRKFKTEVSIQEARALNTKRALMDVLDDDEDMAMMHLTRQKDEPHLFFPTLDVSVLTDHEEFEMLFEVTLQGISTIATNLEHLRLEISNAEDFNNMKLDTARNRLLTADTLFSVISVCLTLGSFIGSIFGMNLKNGFEEDNYMFGRVTLATVTTCLALGVATIVWFSLAGIFVR